MDFNKFIDRNYYYAKARLYISFKEWVIIPYKDLDERLEYFVK